jgi:hypothetical protein
LYFFFFFFLILKIFNINNISFFNIYLISLNHFWLNIFFFLLFFSFFFLYNFITLFIIFLLILISIYLFKWNFVLLDFYVGYFKIHPPLFYMSILFLTYNYISYNYINYKTTQSRLLSLAIITFILGSLWSLYQNIWGYYWTNDSIEYILLFIIVNTMYAIHKYYVSVNKYQLINCLLIYTLIILMRLNFIYTKHNFFLLNIIINKYLIFITFYFIINYFFLSLKLNNKFLFFKNKIYLFIIIVNIVYSIYFNYLNIIFIKIIFYFCFNLIIYIMFFYFITTNSIFLLKHILFFIFICIFNFYVINFILLVKINNIGVNIFKNNLFFKKNNLSLLINKYIKFNYYFFQKKKIIMFNKHENILNLKKKLINYF